MYLQRCLVVTWLVPHETVAVWVWSVYTIQPCTMSHHLMQSHICRVHAGLAVNCHLHFWQNDEDLLHATDITRGGGGGGGGVEWNTEIRQHKKLTLEKKLLTPILLGHKPETF